MTDVVVWVVMAGLLLYGLALAVVPPSDHRHALQQPPARED